MTERNKSMMEYNRRLFATAKMMPRAECLKMLGIIYSNIKEFISVRMPRDTDIASVQNEVQEFMTEFSDFCVHTFTTLTAAFSYNDLDISEEETSESIFAKYGVQKCKMQINDLPNGFYLATPDGTIYSAEERGKFKNRIQLGYHLGVYRRIESELAARGVTNLITLEVIRSHATSPVDVVNTADINAYMSVVESEPISGIIIGSYMDNYDAINEFMGSAIFANAHDVPGFIVNMACVGWDRIASAVYKSTVKLLDRISDNVDRGLVFYPHAGYGWVYYTNSTTTLYRTPYMDYYYILHRLFERQNPSVEIEEVYISLYRFELTGFLYSNILELGRTLGNKLHVLIELTARDNENSNMKAAKELREMGIDVCYGIPGYKVHGKACVILAKDLMHDMRFDVAHVATGNYSEAAQKCFCDTHMITMDWVYVNQILHMLRIAMRKESNLEFPNDPVIWMSPTGLREKLDRLIADQCFTSSFEKRVDGRILIKCNNICDEEIIKKLYDAADCGVKIHIVCRSVCTMRPRKNLKITSIVGQYLEHDRIFIFGPDGREEIYMSSADLMFRNLDERIEFMVKIPERGGLDMDYTEYLMNNIFKAESKKDGSLAVWDMNEEGDWIYRKPKD